MPTSRAIAPAPETSPRAVKDHLLKYVYGGFLLLSGLVACVAFLAIRQIDRAESAADWVNHTHATLYEIDNLGNALLSGDTMVRLYATAGDAHDLAAAREALGPIEEHFATAQALTRDDPAAREALEKLAAGIAARLAFIRELAAARTAGNPAEITRLLAADALLPSVREQRRSLSVVRDALFAQLSERDRAAFRAAQTTRWLVGLGVGVNVLLLAGMAWLIRDDLAARRRLTAALRDANAGLEERVRERTRELSAANDLLTTENMERKWSFQSQEHQLRYNQLIVNSVNDLVFVLTKALNVTRINAAVRQATGADDQAILTQPLAQVVRLRLRDAEPTVEPFRQALADGRELRDLPALLTTSHGAVLPARASLVPLRDRDKVVGGVLIVQLHPTAANAHA